MTEQEEAAAYRALLAEAANCCDCLESWSSGGVAHVLYRP
jgi:hypothetical protein